MQSLELIIKYFVTLKSLIKIKPKDIFLGNFTLNRYCSE